MFLLTDASQTAGILEAFLGKEVFSLCPKEGCTGCVDDRSAEQLKRLLIEMDAAIRAKCFIGANFSNIPHIISVIRNKKNSFLF